MLALVHMERMRQLFEIIFSTSDSSDVLLVSEVKNLNIGSGFSRERISEPLIG